MKKINPCLIALCFVCSCTKSAEKTPAENASVAGSFENSVSPLLDFVYSFDNNKQGWTIEGDAAARFTEEGNPGGAVYGTDEMKDLYWYFRAPQSFIKKVTTHESYNNSLVFDLKAPSSGNTHEPDIIFEAAGRKIVFDLPQDPDAGKWTTYTVKINDASGWRVDSLGGPLARQPQMKFVLSNLEKVLIRGEYFVGPNTGFLDNVTFE